MAYSSITKPGDHFNTLTWTGNGSTPRTLSGLDFQPDWIWGKRRDDAAGHNLIDSVRGFNANSELASSTSGSEGSNAAETYGYLSAVTSDGFTVTAGSSDNAYWNNNTATYVAWNWKAGGSSTTNPSGGTITTTASVNTTAGFSVFTYTGNGSAAHLAHGLGVAPTVVIIKGRSNSDHWFVKHPGIAANEYIYLNNTGAKASGVNAWSATNPDATKIYVGTDGGVNGSGTTYVCYAFAEKKGYSKFGSYTANGNADGSFVYLGFKPAFVIVKRTDSSGDGVLFDNKRPSENPTDLNIAPNTNGAEIDEGQGFDFLSNGFKIREAGNFVNAGGQPFIYMAFAENPFVANDSGTAVPVVAR